MKAAQTLSCEEMTPESSVATQNACKLCAPLGAGIVFRGIENCIPLIHGSQGCSTYIRRYVISHFREPIDIASSNFSEASAIFGGGANLKGALDNLIRQYRPAAIGVATTCLSETIGDDVRLYLDQYRKERRDRTIPPIFIASTPSYRGTHMEGFHAAVRATVEALAEGGVREAALNLLPGFLSAEDLRHLKEVLTDFGIPYTVLPDYSETLDGETWSDYQKLPPGGTPLQSVRAMGKALATVEFGEGLAGLKTAATHLQEAFAVPAVPLGLPIGIRGTDRFFQTLTQMFGRAVPSKYQKERGRLVDAYIDGHKYIFGKRAVVYGEADFVAAMASFLDEIGMIPAFCATGASTGTLKETIQSGLENSRGVVQVREDTDFVAILEACRTIRPDLVIGSSKGYFLSRRLGVPLVRVGFPIHDRIGGQRILHTCYRGAQLLYDRIVNALIDAGQKSSPVGYSYI